MRIECKCSLTENVVSSSKSLWYQARLVTAQAALVGRLVDCLMSIKDFFEHGFRGLGCVSEVMHNGNVLS